MKDYDFFAEMQRITAAYLSLEGPWIPTSVKKDDFIFKRINHEPDDTSRDPYVPEHRS